MFRDSEICLFYHLQRPAYIEYEFDLTESRDKAKIWSGRWNEGPLELTVDCSGRSEQVSADDGKIWAESDSFSERI